jgi:hypothetical protein
MVQDVFDEYNRISASLSETPKDHRPRSCPGRWCRSRLMAVLSDIGPEGPDPSGKTLMATLLLRTYTTSRDTI